MSNHNRPQRSLSDYFTSEETHVALIVLVVLIIISELEVQEAGKPADTTG
ncbi:MAG: hypothetical protein AAF633_08340 [Chloroflexota bacterium]